VETFKRLTGLEDKVEQLQKELQWAIVAEITEARACWVGGKRVGGKRAGEEEKSGAWLLNSECIGIAQSEVYFVLFSLLVSLFVFFCLFYIRLGGRLNIYFIASSTKLWNLKLLQHPFYLSFAVVLTVVIKQL